MTPGLIMVHDPRADRPRPAVAGMLDELRLDAERDRVLTVAGRDWAAALIAPPPADRTCGADWLCDGDDVLLWTGDVFLPEHWGTEAPAAGGAARGGREGIPATEGARKDSRTSIEHWGSGGGRRAITRTLLDQLRADGVAALADADGAFCGAWYDARHGAWTVFNDRLGLLPVFWTAGRDRVVIAPRAWLAGLGAGGSLEPGDDGVIDVLRTTNVVDDHTLIRGVQWLIGGHALRWNGRHGGRPLRGGAGERSAGGDLPEATAYWSCSASGSTFTRADEAIDAYVATLKASVHRHGQCAAPLWLGITGGLDARMILAASDALGRVPNCLTVGWPFSEDVRFGRRLARTAGAPHTQFPMDGDTLPDRIEQAILDSDGLHSSAHLVFSALLTDVLADQAGAVMLEGHYHGIVGGAYVPADDDLPGALAPHETQWARKQLHGGGDIAGINALLRPEHAAESFRRWQTRVDERYHQAPGDDPFARVEYAVAQGRSGRNDVLGPALLRREVVVRSPACDRAFVDWSLRTPALWRRGKRLYGDVLRRCFPRFSHVPRTSGDGLPVTRSRWRRELCWQREKLCRRWLHLRHPWTRAWGISGPAVRAWAFEAWRRTGRLDVLTEPDARVLRWVRRDRLMEAAAAGVADPLSAGPLLHLATIEVMLRRLERLSPPRLDVALSNWRFATIDATPAARGEHVGSAVRTSRP